MTEQLGTRTWDAVDPSVLDSPVWSALSRAGGVVGRAGRYPADVAPFAAVADPADPGAWADLERLVGADEVVVLVGVDAVPASWQVLDVFNGVQMVGHDLIGEIDPAAVRLGAADVPEMTELVRRTEPGPFLPRTVELGDYWGVRQDGALVAMAGERMRLDGWTEISAVCTDPAYRGQGLASRLIRTVAAGILERGDIPFLHAVVQNVSAIRLYESIGFTTRRHITFTPIRRA